MGGSESKENEGGADWQALQHNPQYGQVKSQAYSQTSEATYYGGRRPQGMYGMNEQNIKSEHQKLAAVKVDFDIDVKNLKLEASKSIPNVFDLIFTVTNSTPVDVYISFSAHLQLDRSTGSIMGINPKIPQDSRAYTFNSGTNQPPQGPPCQLNFSHYSFKELSRAYNDTIPVLLILERKTKLPGMLEKVIYFMQIAQKTLTPEVISKSIVINGQLTSLTDVYGISKSILKPTDNQEELCLICFTNGINTMVKPCNHMCICDECAEIMKKKTENCPMCRQKIESFMTLDKR